VTAQRILERRYWRSATLVRLCDDSIGYHIGKCFERQAVAKLNVSTSLPYTVLCATSLDNANEQTPSTSESVIGRPMQSYMIITSMKFGTGKPNNGFVFFVPGMCVVLTANKLHYRALTSRILLIKPVEEQAPVTS